MPLPFVTTTKTVLFGRECVIYVPSVWTLSQLDLRVLQSTTTVTHSL